ncbi:hypothetical protein EVAR_100558_1 [Eumeta japonica]|uniref:Uncharacterized protein n=1 Tax=Eumeta variegata TaxID=151549 RepID=A0A4C1ZX13_EUMVA|nr:hypothetical protein EVAR_100558_1 [Eumeta japonica]
MRRKTIHSHNGSFGLQIGSRSVAGDVRLPARPVTHRALPESGCSACGSDRQRPLATDVTTTSRATQRAFDNTDQTFTFDMSLLLIDRFARDQDSNPILSDTQAARCSLTTAVLFILLFNHNYNRKIRLRMSESSGVPFFPHHPILAPSDILFLPEKQQRTDGDSSEITLPVSMGGR